MENTTAGLISSGAHIKTYAIRSGRMSDAQKKALETLYAAYGVNWEPCVMLNSERLFGKSAPFIIEIGFGMGNATEHIAQALPETCFLGIEVHAPGVARLLSSIHANKLHNLRVMWHDALEVLSEMIADNSVSGFHIFFPDPWPKKRHHKRRLIRTDVVQLLSSKLKNNAYIYFVSDWQEYAEAALEVLSADATLYNACPTESAPWAQRAPWRPHTKFELRALNDGRLIRELMFAKRSPK